MAATAGLSLTLDPMGKMFQNASPLKLLSQSQPNFAEMILGWFPFKIMFVSAVLIKDGRHY